MVYYWSWNDEPNVEDGEVIQLRRTLASFLLCKCVSYCQQGHVGSKALLQQNPLVLNWGCQLTQIVLSCHKMVVLDAVCKCRRVWYLLQALSILRGISVGAFVQLTVSKCSAPAGDDVSDSDSSATPVNMSASDIVSIATATIPGISIHLPLLTAFLWVNLG